MPLISLVGLIALTTFFEATSSIKANPRGACIKRFTAALWLQTAVYVFAFVSPTAAAAGTNQCLVKIKLPPSSGPSTGRLMLAITHGVPSAAAAEPRLAVTKNSDSTGQVFGTDVVAAPPGAVVGFPVADTFGYPMLKPDSIPEGEYAIQGVYLPYEFYNRSDGAAVWLPSFDATTYSHNDGLRRIDNGTEFIDAKHA